MRPVIALAMGDPAGISPELTAKLLALDEVVDKARIVVIGDRRVLDDGARIAGGEARLGIGITRRRPLARKSGPRSSSISAISIRPR